MAATQSAAVEAWDAQGNPVSAAPSPSSAQVEAWDASGNPVAPSAPQAPPAPASAGPGFPANATVSARPSWSQQALDMVRHPLNSLESAAQPVSRPRDATMGEMLGADVANVGAGAASVIRHPIDTAKGILSSGFGLRPVLETAENAIVEGAGKPAPNPNVHLVPQTPEQAAFAGGQALATAGAAKAIPPIAKAGINVAGALGDDALNEGASQFRERNPAPGENFSPVQAKSHAAVIAEGNAGGDTGYIPRDIAQATGSRLRQVAAASPNEVAAIRGGTPEDAFAAHQSILEKAKQGIDQQHEAALAPVADTPVDMGPVQRAIQPTKYELEGMDQADAGALTQLQERAGQVQTLRGLNEFRKQLSTEDTTLRNSTAQGKSALYPQSVRSLYSAVRDAYYDALEKATGQDFQPLKRLEGNIIAEQRGAVGAGSRLSAGEAKATAPQSIGATTADVLEGAGHGGLPRIPVVSAFAERLRGTKLGQIQQHLQRFYSKLPDAPAAAAEAPPAPGPAGLLRNPQLQLPADVPANAEVSPAGPPQAPAPAAPGGPSRFNVSPQGVVRPGAPAPPTPSVITPAPDVPLQLPAQAGPDAPGVGPVPSTTPPPFDQASRFTRTRAPLAPNPEPAPPGRFTVSPEGVAVPERPQLPAPAPKVRAGSKFAKAAKPAPAAPAPPPVPELFAPRKVAPVAAAQPAEAIAGRAGNQTSLKTPTAEYPATYKLVEAGDLQPSHNAQTFAPNPQYPEGVQERAYDTSPEAQARVVHQAQNFDPAYVINDNPDAVNGPPIVTPDGLVLGGNSRAMSLQRLYQGGGADAYRTALKGKAQSFGLNPADVDSMKNPVLVREVAKPADADATRRMGSELNKNMTGALGGSERAVSAGKNLKPDTLRRVSDMLGDGDISLRELMGQRGPEIVRMLTNDGVITDRERPQYVDQATGGLNDEGKQFVERALLGSVIDDPRLMDATPKSLLQKLEKSMGPITSFSGRADEWNLLPAVRQAVAEHGFIQRSGTPFETYLGQRALFGERNPLVDTLIRALDKNQNAVRDAFRTFARDSDQNRPGQARFFQGGDAFDAFNHAFGGKLTAQEYHNGLEEAAGTDPSRAQAPPDPSSGQSVPGVAAPETGAGGHGSASSAPQSQSPEKVAPSDSTSIKTRSGKSVSVGDNITVNGRRGRVAGVNPETGKLRVEWETE